MENIKPKSDEKNSYYFAICLKENNNPIGYVAISSDEGHDFGYGLQKEYCNSDDSAVKGES